MDLLKDNQKRHEIKFLINSKDKHELIDKNQLKVLAKDIGGGSYAEYLQNLIKTIS